MIILTLWCREKRIYRICVQYIHKIKSMIPYGQHIAQRRRGSEWVSGESRDILLCFAGNIYYYTVKVFAKTRFKRIESGTISWRSISFRWLDGFVSAEM